MKTIKNQHDNDLYAGSSVYFYNHIAEVLQVHRIKATIQYTDFNLRKVIKRVYATELPLIHNCNVNQITT